MPPLRGDYEEPNHGEKNAHADGNQSGFIETLAAAGPESRGFSFRSD